MLVEAILTPHVFSESEMACCIESYQKWAMGSNTEGGRSPDIPLIPSKQIMLNNTIKRSFGFF